MIATGPRKTLAVVRPRKNKDAALMSRKGVA